MLLSLVALLLSAAAPLIGRFSSSNLVLVPARRRPTAFLNLQELLSWCMLDISQMLGIVSCGFVVPFLWRFRLSMAMPLLLPALEQLACALVTRTGRAGQAAGAGELAQGGSKKGAAVAAAAVAEAKVTVQGGAGGGAGGAKGDGDSGAHGSGGTGPSHIGRAAMLADALEATGTVRELGVRYCLLILLVLHARLCNDTFTYFKCRKVQGVYYLAADYRRVCYEGAHKSHLVLGVVGMVVFAIGIPAGMLYIAWKYKSEIFDPDHPDHKPAHRKFGIVGAGLRQECFYFEFVERMRTFLLTGGLVLCSDEAAAQSLLGILVAVMHMSAVLCLEPYDELWTNVASALTSFHVMVTLSVGLALRVNAAEDALEESVYDGAALTAVLVASQLLVLGCCLASLTFSMLELWNHEVVQAVVARVRRRCGCARCRRKEKRVEELRKRHWDEQLRMLKAMHSLQSALEHESELSSGTRAAFQALRRESMAGASTGPAACACPVVLRRGARTQLKAPAADIALARRIALSDWSIAVPCPLHTTRTRIPWVHVRNRPDQEMSTGEASQAQEDRTVAWEAAERTSEAPAGTSTSAVVPWAGP